MTNARNRREAAKRLGLEFRKHYAALVDAKTNDEVGEAAVILGATFNTNIEFVIWVLLEFGSVEQMPFAPLTEARPLPGISKLVD